MHRRAGLALGVALAFVAGLAAAACGPGDTPDTDAYAASEESAVGETAQTTAATLPVVTVYKSPT